MDETIGQNIGILIPGRHVPYRMENGDVVIENNMILITDKYDGLIYSCQATIENLISLKVIPMSTTTCTASPMHTPEFDSESQVIDSNEITKSSGTKWSKEAVLFLIEQWKKNSTKFASATIRNEEVWKDINVELENVGFTRFTWKQVLDKWKNLRKAYMKVKDNIGDKSSGAPKITCKFFDELDEVFRKSPSVDPISVASSRKFTNLPSSSNKNVRNEDTELDPDDADYDFSQHQPKKKKTKLQKDSFTFMSILRDDANAREAAREERHQQTLNVLNRAVDSYETLMQKLIDKL